MRKGVPSGDCFVGEALYQTVVPGKFCGLVLGAFHGVGCLRSVGRCLPVGSLVVGCRRFVGRCLPVRPWVVGCRRFVGRCLPVSRLVVGCLRFVGGLGVCWSLVALGLCVLLALLVLLPVPPLLFLLLYSRLCGLLMRMDTGLRRGDPLCPRLLGGRVTASSAVKWLHLGAGGFLPFKRMSGERVDPSVCPQHTFCLVGATFC